MSRMRSQLTPVFWVSAALTLAFVVWGVVFAETLSSVAKSAREVVVVDLNTLTQGTGIYVADVIPMSFRLNAFQQGDTWAGDRTLFYWVTWIGWSPFVGSFIARISRGRTIHELVVARAGGPEPGRLRVVRGVRLGGHRPRLAARRSAQPRVPAGRGAGAFAFLAYFPLSNVLAGLVIVLVLIFFVAGVDAATIVRRLQEAALLTALPFTFIILAMCWALWRALRSEIAEEQPSDPSARTSFPSTVAGDAGSLP